jgi:hypothetical protein
VARASSSLTGRAAGFSSFSWATPAF